MSNLEKTKYEKIKPYAIIGSYFVGTLLAVSGIAAAIDRTDAESTYRDTFVDDGQCLDKTPFDPEMGAVISLDETGSDNVLMVVPKAANSYKPSVLFLRVQGDGLNRPHLVFADKDSAALVTDAVCPNQPEGF